MSCICLATYLDSSYMNLEPHKSELTRFAPSYQQLITDQDGKLGKENTYNAPGW
jgi:hypothetical protein